DRTPFYAESGGQVSDQGVIRSASVLARVEQVGKAPRGQHVMTVTVEQGELRVGDEVTAEVDRIARAHTVRHHTATHLLHRALKQVLGEHVNQAGALVEPERLRVDFSHFGGVSAEELAKVEQLVNEQIWLNTELD